MMDGVPAPQDFHSKYQKLASEYSKLRAQVPVLKKAVLDEQAKTAELTNVVKDKELSLRKIEHEMDSVNFRNQQLERRVSVLQDELDALQMKPKKGKSKHVDTSTNSSTSHIFNEELQSKIAENARLHTLLQEEEREHECQINELKSELEDTRHKLEQYEHKQGTTTVKAKEIIEKLQLEKVSLELKAQKMEEEVNQLQCKVGSMQEEFGEERKVIKSQLDTASAIIQDQLPFVDTRDWALNTLNIPVHDQKHQMKAKEVIEEMGSCIQELASSLSNFHTYSEQRLQMYPESNPKKWHHMAKKFSAFLNENAKILRAMEQAYTTFQKSIDDNDIISLETATGLQDFSEKFNTYNAFLQKILPYHLLQLQEESSLPSCGKSLEDKNKVLIQCLETFVTIFGKLSNYVTILSVQSKRACQHSACCQRRFLKEISQILLDLHGAAKELSKVYNSKATVEQEMPNIADKISPTNACIVSSLVVLATATGKISGLVHDNIDELCKPSGGKRRNTDGSKGVTWERQIHPSVSMFKKRAANYLSLLDEEQSPSVPYEDALKNQEILLYNTESSESLSKQLATNQEKLNKLEQAKEHWKLEFQLLQMKYEKETKRFKDLEEHLHGTSGATTPQTEASSVTGHSRTGSTASGESAASGSAVVPANILTSTMVAKLEMPFGAVDDSTSNEQEVKAYFTKRLNEFVAELQQADSKAVTFQAECISLQKRLQLGKEMRRNQERELEALRSTLAKVQEDLVTTTQNYESQLSMMSDHLATMNEKLTIQQDEIEDLKYQLGSKANKKGKQK